MLEKIHTDKAPAAIGPYSQAIKIGNRMLSSGQIAINPSTGNIEGTTIKEQTVQVPADGKLKLTVDGDVRYLRGVSPDMARAAKLTPNPDRWPEDKTEVFVRNSRILKPVTRTPSFTGNMKEWENLTELAMTNPRVNGDDASGFAYLGYDREYLYIGWTCATTKS